MAEIAKTGWDAWTLMVDVITVLLSSHGRKPAWPAGTDTQSGVGTPLFSSVHQRDRISGSIKHTLPDLVESASGADASLVGLLPLCPL